MSANRPPLGGLGAGVFLRDYWQKRPLLVRQAMPGFRGPLGLREIFSLAGREDTESRLISAGAGRTRWRLRHGPFDRRELAALAARNWTLLVNGVNFRSRGADALLQRFAFVSWARLDDVMLSHAVDGGGVGPHADSYDVFLLQGRGMRRWRLMPPPRGGFRLVANSPVKRIANFRWQEEMTLGPGDMLYVPPGWGHEGTALGTCQTWSIGFRAPGGAELSAAFLDYLHERGFADRAYTDPGRKPARHPARIDAQMIDFAAHALGRIRWNRADVAAFLGRHLSEPNRNAVFSPPERPRSRAAFAARLSRSTIRLAAGSRLLAAGTGLYLNGEPVAAGAAARRALLALGDHRTVDGAQLARGTDMELIYEWYTQGVVEIEPPRAMGDV